ncbi:hypothetical protein M404DRAFT_21519 [Pisolithus tinctorius Marx 270]|uniref:Uncharacterized protein n=1 Tax=Pisolithus tinctorius Marx 270 TaxID=870435 RepID=A0A0C3PN54_PISTI|nr:hypothetical protein M404DRAFT_21519 [Pisolithus tinctorius Marx 270]
MLGGVILEWLAGGRHVQLRFLIVVSIAQSSLAKYHGSISERLKLSRTFYFLIDRSRVVWKHFRFVHDLATPRSRDRRKHTHFFEAERRDLDCAKYKPRTTVVDFAPSQNCPISPAKIIFTPPNGLSFPAGSSAFADAMRSAISFTINVVDPPDFADRNGPPYTLKHESCIHL